MKPKDSIQERDVPVPVLSGIMHQKEVNDEQKLAKKKKQKMQKLKQKEKKKTMKALEEKLGVKAKKKKKVGRQLGETCLGKDFQELGESSENLNEDIFKLIEDSQKPVEISMNLNNVSQKQSNLALIQTSVNSNANVSTPNSFSIEEKGKLQKAKTKLKKQKKKKKKKIPGLQRPPLIETMGFSDLTSEVYAEFKRKEHLIRKWPLMLLNNVGKGSLLSVSEEKRSPLFMSDIQAGFLQCTLGSAPRSPRWMTIQRLGKLAHVVLVVIEGVSMADIADAAKPLPDTVEEEVEEVVEEKVVEEEEVEEELVEKEEEKQSNAPVEDVEVIKGRRKKFVDEKRRPTSAQDDDDEGWVEEDWEQRLKKNRFRTKEGKKLLKQQQEAQKNADLKRKEADSQNETMKGNLAIENVEEAQENEAKRLKGEKKKKAKRKIDAEIMEEDHGKGAKKRKVVEGEEDKTPKTQTITRQVVKNITKKIVKKNEKKDLDRMTDVLPRITRSMQYKMEVIAPSKYDVGAIDEIIKIPISNVKKNSLTRKLGDIEKARKKGLVLKSMGVKFPTSFNNEDGWSEPVSQHKNEYETKPQFQFEYEPELESELEPKSHAKKLIKKPRVVKDKFDRRQLLLSVEDLYVHNYPLAVEGSIGFNDPEFVYTSKSYKEVQPNSPMFGVDCEMCMTNIRQLELTSISIVNEDMKLVYDKLVKPYNPIINYLTQFSGITKAMLAPVHTRLEDVQEDLRALLPPDAILVGHSLNSDLKAMKMMHPYVIDSSLVYNLTYSRHHRTSLKKLTKQFLFEDIQCAGADGHDATEDAGASLKLVQLKLLHDITFGDVIQGGATEPLTTLNQEPHLENEWVNEEEETEEYNYKMDTEMLQEKKDTYLTTSLFDHGKKLNMAMLSTPRCLSNYNDIMHTISGNVPYFEVLDNNKQLSLQTADLAQHKNFTYVHMKLSSKLKKCANKKARRAVLKTLDKQLSRIHDSAAEKGLVFFVFPGSGLDVPTNKRSNGFVLLNLKGHEKFPIPLEQ